MKSGEKEAKLKKIRPVEAKNGVRKTKMKELRLDREGTRGEERENKRIMFRTRERVGIKTKTRGDTWRRKH